MTIVGFVGPPSGILRYTREKIEARVTIITLMNKNLLAVGCCVWELASLKFVLFSTKFRFSFGILSDNPQMKYKHFVQQDDIGCSNVDSKWEILESFVQNSDILETCTFWDIYKNGVLFSEPYKRILFHIWNNADQIKPSIFWCLL